MTKKRTEITIETERALIFNRRRITTIWCETCSSEAAMVTADEAASLFGLSSGAIFEQSQRGAIHYSPSSDGQALICLRSLIQDEQSNLR